ncbi:hypothetical protein P3342_012385 [Pyrenophora teres f. teres]|uniref:Uncharacterized protein n=2 Tax=Pyrenophora teres f. teres TaxID=97479 RepID=E3RQL8_PYRTT|nr:hypothetical protein PTT_11030 [Pyrenophora teres f. teres 0-1]KAE8823955.1 hypothetical protein HRS9139_09137 [Pyrenophora teres f. teres]KAE8825075.1 hypothetical protein HRS9122_10174 [Pyrenophora teres f. teres]KAE8827160.1 hypothetical protein PTNB85_08513 [Pyrenophora teres f. teres]KAE8855009.1 hypothetical protein PTNB29_09260 [Pyrenophora teres f. teres]
MPSTKASNRVSKPRSKQSRSRNAEPVRKLRTLLPMPPREEERRAPGILSDNFSRSMVHPPVPVQGYNMTQHLVANQNFTYNQAAAWQPVIPAPMSASRTQMQASAQVGKLPPNVHVALVVMPFMLEEGKWHVRICGSTPRPVSSHSSSTNSANSRLIAEYTSVYPD